MKIVSEPVDMIAKFTSAGDRGEKNGEKPVPCKFRYTDIAGISREVRIDRIISADPGIFGGVREYTSTAARASSEIQKKYTNSNTSSANAAGNSIRYDTLHAELLVFSE